MITSLKKSLDLGCHFDLFWKYLWWVRYLPSLKWIGQVLLEKTSDTADPNSEVEIGLKVLHALIDFLFTSEQLLSY